MAGGNFSHLVTNPKMKQILSDVSYFINFGEKTTKCPYPHGSRVPIEYKKYMGKCTYGPTTWYQKAGIQLSFWNGKKPSNASVDDMKKSLSACGMVAVWHGTLEQAKSTLTSSKMLRPGDVGSMLSSNSAHGVMWTGEDWRADCNQGTNPVPYNSPGRGGDWTFILWRHPALQEPGKTVEGVGLGNFPTGGSFTDSGGDTSAWCSAVDQMKSWYESNIHTYQKLWSIECPLINGHVRDDCSGFVNACLCLYGTPTYDTSSGKNAPASYYMMQDDYAAKISSSFIRIPYSKEDLQPYDIIVGNAVDGNQHGHTEIYAGDRKSFSWGNIHDLDAGGMPSPTAWTFNGGTTYSYIFRCNGSGSSYMGGGLSLTKDQLAEELADKCPKEIGFKGLWMRYHLFAGEKSPIIKEIMNAHTRSGDFYGPLGGGLSFSGAMFSFNGFNLPQEIINYVNEMISQGMTPNSQHWNVDTYKANISTFLNVMTSAGLSPLAAICIAGAASQEAGFSGNFKPEPTELAKRGIAYAGEGLFGFTSWPTKLKLILATGVNLPITESEYVRGRHISDLGWEDQCKLAAAYVKSSKYFKYFTSGANPGDTACASYLFKAGNWKNSGNLWADTQDAVSRYKSTHAKYGYRVRDSFAEQMNVAMKIAQAFSGNS